MKSTAKLAQHMRELHFGGNWTHSNLKDVLADVNWEQATQKVNSFNTIATLVYHIHYYVHAVSEVLEGKPLVSKDELSFNHPPIHSEEDWNQFLVKVWKDAETFSNLIEALPNSQLWETLEDEKYGDFYRNLLGILEHSHYHLGQIALIKKIVQ